LYIVYIVGYHKCAADGKTRLFITAHYYYYAHILFQGVRVMNGACSIFIRSALVLW